MNDLEKVFTLPPYGLPRDEKQQLLVERLNGLNAHHRAACGAYRKIQLAFGADGRQYDRIEDFPYLPIRLFKEFDLKSVADNEVIKTLTSSGTTGSRVSRIYLDKDTSHYQTKALACIVQDFIGRKRLPMIIIDSPGVIKDRQLFSARGAGILGMANFGREHLYVLDDNMNLRTGELHAFMEQHQGEEILLFGFTFMVWQHFYRALAESRTKIDLGCGILIHSGGWKKLAEEAVDNAAFRRALKETCGIERIHNFYGMVEQVGSVYMECEAGHLHAPIFSDIVVRSPHDWSPLDHGRQGVIEVLSILPHSYPGHVLLTEDMGEILGEDDCRCRRKGKYFRMSGRIPKAEIRGCSDTYES